MLHQQRLPYRPCLSRKSLERHLVGDSASRDITLHLVLHVAKATTDRSWLRSTALTKASTASKLAPATNRSPRSNSKFPLSILRMKEQFQQTTTPSKEPGRREARAFPDFPAPTAHVSFQELAGRCMRLRWPEGTWQGALDPTADALTVCSCAFRTTRKANSSLPWTSIDQGINGFRATR